MTGEPPVFVRPDGPRRSGGQVAVIVIGGIVGLAGVALLLSAVALLAIVGTDGTVSTARGPLRTPTSALVSQPATLSDTAGVADVLGKARIRISADGSEPLFIGVGRARRVERYLRGIAVEEVTDIEDLDPLELDLRRVDGHDDARAPTGQSFWAAQGADTLSWKVRDGNFRIVLMNADGSPGVDATGRLGVKIPFLPGIGYGVLGAGVLLALGGVAAIVLALRRREPGDAV